MFEEYLTPESAPVVLKLCKKSKLTGDCHEQVLINDWAKGYGRDNVGVPICAGGYETK
jgi:hypothetical protein